MTGTDATLQVMADAHQRYRAVGALHVFGLATSAELDLAREEFKKAEEAHRDNSI